MQKEQATGPFGDQRMNANSGYLASICLGKKFVSNGQFKAEGYSCMTDFIRLFMVKDQRMSERQNGDKEILYIRQTIFYCVRKESLETMVKK